MRRDVVETVFDVDKTRRCYEKRIQARSDGHTRRKLRNHHETTRNSQNVEYNSYKERYFQTSASAPCPPRLVPKRRTERIKASPRYTSRIVAVVVCRDEQYMMRVIGDYGRHRAAPRRAAPRDVCLRGRR